MKIKQELQSKYVFQVEYRKGPAHIVPDALSRSPVRDPNMDVDKTIDEDNSNLGFIAAITKSQGIMDLNIKNIEEQARKDIKYQKL